MEGTKNVPVVHEIMQEMDPDVVLLQEIWLRSENANQEFLRYFPDYDWKLKLADEKKEVEEALQTKRLSHWGTALGVKKGLTDNFLDIDSKNGNNVIALAEIKGVEILLGSLYLPTRGKDHQFEEETAALTGALEMNMGERPVILGGDLNCDIDSTVSRIAVWQCFLEDNDLCDHQTGGVTHRHHIWGNRNELDRFVTRGIMPVNNKVLTDYTGHSDHTPILSSYKLEIKKKKKPALGGKVAVKINMKKLKEQLDWFMMITDEVSVELDSYLDNVPLDTACGIISRCIFKVALGCTGQKEFQSQKKRKQRRIMISRELMKERRKLRKQWRRRKNGEGNRSWEELKEMSRRVKEEMRREADEGERKLNERIIETARRDPMSTFKLLRDLKQKTSTTSELPSKITGYDKTYEDPYIMEGIRSLFEIQTTLDVKEFFEPDLFHLAKVKMRAKDEQGVPEGDQLHMTRRQFDEVLRGLKTGKSPDIYGLSNDLLKLSGQKMKDLVYKHCQKSLETCDTGGITRNFGRGVVMKKSASKPPTEISSWRKIVSNPVIPNIIQIFAMRTIEEKAREHQTDLQLGFTRGVDLGLVVALRNEVQAHCWRKKTQLIFVSLDLRSCFPSISRQHLLMLLSDILSPAEYRLVKELYSNTFSTIQVAGQETDLMEATRGLVEGGFLSPTLAKVHIATLLRMVKEIGMNAEVNFSEDTVGDGAAAVADDVCGWLVGEDADEKAQRFLDIAEKWGNMFFSEFNSAKCEIICSEKVTEATMNRVFTINNQEVKKVNESVHLGTIITRKPNPTRAVKERITKCRKMVSATICYFSTRSVVTLAIRIELYRTTYKAVLMYSQDSTAHRRGDFTMLENFQLNLLRSMLGLSGKSRKVAVLLMCGIQYIESDCWRRRINLLRTALYQTDTIATRFIKLNISTETPSWSSSTAREVERLCEEVGMEQEHLMNTTKENFKENLKLIFQGRDIRKMAREVEDSSVDTRTLLVPSAKPFGGVFEILKTDFSENDNNHAKSVAKILSGDIWKHWVDGMPGPCRMCLQFKGERHTDTVLHMLSSQCCIAWTPKVHSSSVRLRNFIAEKFPTNLFSSILADETKRVQFWLRPESLHLLGDNAISPQDIQSSRLGVILRGHLHLLWATRKSLHEEYGLTAGVEYADSE